MAIRNDYRSSYELVEVVGDGDTLCARFHDSVNLQESPAGFGRTDAEAIAELAAYVRDNVVPEAVAAEREACAKMLENIASMKDEIASRGDEAAAYEASWTRACAKAIRQRGGKEQK